MWSNWYVCESWCCGFFLLVVVVPSILPQPPCLVVDSLAAWWPVCPCCLPACDPLSISYNLLYCVFSSFLASFLLVISRASSNFFLNWHFTMWYMVMDVGRIVDNTKRTREQKPKKFHRPTICSYQQLLIASLLINNKHIQLIENALRICERKNGVFYCYGFNCYYDDIYSIYGAT